MSGQRLYAWMTVAVLGLVLCLAVPVGVFAGSQDDSPRGRRPKARSDSGQTSRESTSSKARTKDKKKKAEKRTKRRGSYEFPTLPSNDRREAKFLRDLGEGFKVKHTKHYTIFYNTNEEDVKIFAVDIEKIYTQVIKYIYKMGVEIKEPKTKLFTHYFDTFEQYSIHSIQTGNGPIQEGALGFYMPVSLDASELNPLSNMTYFYNVRNTPWFRGAKRAAEAAKRAARERNKGRKLRGGERKAVARASRAAQAQLTWVNNRGFEMTESALQHEVTHQVLFNVGFHNFGSQWGNPRWLAEGMAQIFETPSNGSAWGVALVNEGRLENFRTLQKHDMLVPVRDFVSDPRWFFRSDAGSLAYPQSWAMIHYITRKHREKLKDYIDMLNARPVDFKTTPEKELETFEQAFGPLNEKWERTWLAFMDHLRT